MNAPLAKTWLPPIAIPMPEEGLLSPDPGHLHDTETFSRLTSLAIPTQEIEHLAFYRWMVGHHIAICAWRMMDEELRKTSTWPQEENEHTRNIASVMDVYTAALVYAGSCSPETYGAVIRPAMIAANPSFSGTWARDYESLRKRITICAPSSSSAFMQVYRKNHQVHIHLGKHLVPQGKSLLQETGHAHCTITEPERKQFDQFFLVDRRPTSWGEFKLQFLRCLYQCLSDLRIRPLVIEQYPSVCQDVARACTEILSKLSRKLGEYA
jgi:hypothetical protein